MRWKAHVGESLVSISQSALGREVPGNEIKSL